MTDTERGMTHEEALGRAFTALWEAFVEGVGIEPDYVETIIESTGLATWTPATEADVEATRERLDIEVGDMLLKLTDEGRRIVREVR